MKRYNHQLKLIQICISGGQTVGGDPSSATSQILKFKIDPVSGVENWEILPYELAVARRLPSAISLNTNNYRNTEKQDCQLEFQPKAMKTAYQQNPLEFSKDQF